MRLGASMRTRIAATRRLQGALPLRSGRRSCGTVSVPRSSRAADVSLSTRHCPVGDEQYYDAALGMAALFSEMHYLRPSLRSRNLRNQSQTTARAW
jgi:hypothetical protein